MKMPNYIKFVLQMPLIITSSVMCILNSFEKDGDSNMKIPNIVVNGYSVFIMSLQNNLKVSEKVELFKKLSNQYLILAHSIEALEPENITRDMVNNFTEQYDLLQSQCLFEDIPQKYKKEVINSWKNRALPLQLNGERNSRNSSIEISSEIV